MPNPQPGQEQMMELCEECGLPIVECNAVAMARKETERWLRDEGYGGIDARKRAAELVPSTRPAADPGEYGELRLRKLLQAAHPVPWELQDGSSWRRIGTKHGPCGNVLCPTNCRHDNHPDLTASDGLLHDNLSLIVEGINALPALLDRLETQAADIARLREVLGEAIGNLDDCLSILQSGKWSNTNDIANFIKVARAALSPNPTSP